MDEKNKVHNLRNRVVKCVGKKAQDGKCVESLQKQTMGINFNLQNSQ